MAMVSFGIFVARPIRLCLLWDSRKPSMAIVLVRLLKPHDVVPTIDVNRFAGNSRARFGQQEYGGSADLARIDVAFQRRAFSMGLQHFAEIRDAARGERL